MPRKAPDKVIEHRISFSDLERKQLIETIATMNDLAPIRAYSQAGSALLGSGAVVYGALALGFFWGIPNLWKWVANSDLAKAFVKYGQPTQTLETMEFKIRENISDLQTRIEANEQIINDPNATNAAKAHARKENAKLTNDKIKNEAFLDSAMYETATEAAQIAEDARQYGSAGGVYGLYRILFD